MGELIIAPSAYRHGVRGTDMRHAFDHPMFVEDLDDGFVMLVGGSRTGQLLEIGVVVGRDGPVIVHPMPARGKYLR